jgi:hypothetical protein
MISENKTSKRYWYIPYEGYELRSQRRLRVDLGVDEDTAEVILHLRSQVIELQAHIRQMEAELSDQKASQRVRLARYREVYCEAIWIEK